MWSLLGYDEEEQQSTYAGKVGLRNFGNSCFVSAGLQCLCHLEPLRRHFLRSDATLAKNFRTSTSRHGGEVAAAFMEVVASLWQGAEPVQDARAFHRKLAPLAPQLFDRSEQQDVQEFLAFLLDALHGDLNRAPWQLLAAGAPESVVPSKATHLSEEQDSEELAAAANWLEYLERDRSLLVDVLQGQLRSCLTCPRCGLRSRKFNPFQYLSVPVTSQMTALTDAIEEFLREETLSASNQWFCPQCQCKVAGLKKIDIWKLPPVLMLHLKRFEFNRRTLQFQKIDGLLSTDLRLDLTQYCASPQKDGATYDVVCVANHAGHYGYGHYTATCRVGHPDRNEWCHFDDDCVEPLPSTQPVVGKEAYVLFLQRRPPEGQPACCRRQSLSMPQHWPHSAAVVNLMCNSGSKARSSIIDGQGAKAVSEDPALIVSRRSSASLPAAADPPVRVAADADPPTQVDAVVEEPQGSLWWPALTGSTMAPEPLPLVLFQGWLCRCISESEGQWSWSWVELREGSLLFYVDASCQDEVYTLELNGSTEVESPWEPCGASGGTPLWVFSVTNAVKRQARVTSHNILATDTYESLLAWTQAVENIASGDLSVERRPCCTVA